MKTSFKHVSLFLLMMWISIGSAYATTAAGTYTLVKGANNSTYLETGQYVIGYVSTNMRGAPAFGGAGAQNLKGGLVNSYMTGSYYALDEVCTLTLDGSEGVCEWTVTNDGYDSYTIFDGTYYMCAKSDNKNKLWASTSKAGQNATWEITHHKGVSYTACSVVNEASVDYGTLGNSGETLSGYGSGTTSKIYFFKKTDDLYDITLSDAYSGGGNNTMDARVGGVSVTKAAEDATVTLSQTANPNYCFDSWYVEDEDGDEVTVTSNSFTMPAKDVTVYAYYNGCGTLATVTAASSESVSQTTATVRCASGISSKGDACCAITEYGFVISAKATNSDPLIDGSGVTKHQIGTSYTTLSTAFSKALTGLTANTTYCVKAYAINGYGTAYSAVHEFTTAAEVVFGNYVQSCSDYHTVTYDQNTGGAAYTGTLPEDDNEYAEGATVYVSNGTIGRTGYDFVGWNTNPAATVGISEFEMGASDATLYAVWSPIDYTLTMATNLNTATSNAAITSPRAGAGDVADKHYGESITVTVVAPPHHTFVNWTCSAGTLANASATSTTFTMPAGNTTVTANFTEDTKYTVTWSDNGDTNTEQVYSGETTTFPALSSDCELYVAAGWVQDNSNTFVSETMTAPGTIYAVDATTPAVSANVTYKAVYRHKYYTTDEFVLNTTTSGGYYLSANPGTRRYSAAKDGSKLGTTTSLASAIPVYLEKEETGKYSFKTVAVSGEQYLAGSSGGDFSWKDSKTGDYKWSVAAGEQGKGDWHILNAGTNNTRAIIYNNSSGNYIGNYLGTNVTSSGTTYYDIDLIPAYYYMYSPDAACYDITISTNGWDRATWETLDGSHKLQGNQLTVTPACGYHITSVSITNGTFTPSSGYTTHDPVTFTIIPSGNCTFTVNFNKTPSDDDKYTISYLDGSSVMAQTKTAAVKACGTVTLPNGYNSASGAGGICTGWTFDGWTQTEYTFGQLSEPTGIQAANSEQTVSGDQTWYAVYHKTFAAGDYFYLKYGANYVTSFNSSAHKFVAGSTESTNALLFAMESNYLYYLDPSTRNKMWVYADGNTVDVTATETKPSSTAYQTTMTLVNGTYQITNGNNRYLSANGTDVKYYSGTSYTHATKPNASSFTAYYPKTDCAVETARITFNPGAGNTCALEYVDAEIGSTISLPVAADVSGYDADWTFYGWSPTEVTNIATAAPAIVYSGGANYLVTVSTTLYAVYTQTPPDGNFDNTKGGKYKIWAIKNGVYYYATSGGERKGKLGATTDCSEGALFELTRNDVTGGYKIRINGETKYLKGAGNDDTDFDYVLAASAPEWTITDVHSTSPNGYWRISSGIQHRAIVFGHSNFGHYDATQIANSPTMWFDVYLGQCSDNYYTSNPNKSLSLTGDIRVTSTNGESVKATNTIAVKGNLLAGTTFTATSANNHFAVAIADNTITDGVVNTTMSITYTPAAYGTTESSIITVTASDKSQQIEVYGRSLPENFAIVAKCAGNWYALPNTCTTSGTPAGLLVTVDDNDAPTEVTLAPHDIEFGLQDVVGTRTDYKDRFYLFEQKTGDKHSLKDNSGANIELDAQAGSISGSNSHYYEWLPTTTDMQAYTLKNTSESNKNLSINESGNFGTHAENVVSDVIYLLPITAYYVTAKMQVLEWKANSVVVMYTGSQTSATTKVGDNTASDPQTLSSQKLTHGIYELTTNRALTANAGSVLQVSFGSGAETALVTIPIIINSAVTASESHEAEDVIIVSGGKLTAASDKYSFRNIYVYGGGKLKIASGSQLGVNNIILRAGGVTTNGSGGSATYAYTYPQVELGGTLSSTQTNIKYEYITDYDHWYQLCLPFNATLSSIHYPQEYYGDNVTAANSGSWVIKRYAGEVRATGEYNAWVDIESESATQVNFGHGYLFWGAPKKVSVGGAAKQRQMWGIQRMTMPIAAAAATTAETNDKNITVDSYSDVEGKSTKPNDQGWNLVGNPYMVNLTDLSSMSIIAGKLVQEKDDKENWTGKWRNNGDGVRYVTIPDYHFDNYVAKTASVAAGAGDFMPGRAFFVQIAEGATTLTFAAANRASLMPALFARTEQKIDVETGIVLSDESKHDEVNFWIKDGKTEAYEYNADYPKTMNTTNFNIYGVHSNGELSWVAISPEIAEGSMAIGYQVPAAGDYMLSLSETYVSDEIEHVFVTDHGVSPEVTTDLMEEDYNFYVNQAETNDVRFTVAFKLKEEDPGTVTSVENATSVDSDKPLKFIYNDKMYILRNGIIYDATGKKVREIK